MTINLTLADPANHPASWQLTDERLIRVRGELLRSLKYRNGNSQDNITADAVKGLDELIELRKLVTVDTELQCNGE